MYGPPNQPQPGMPVYGNPYPSQGYQFPGMSPLQGAAPFSYGSYYNAASFPHYAGGAAMPFLSSVAPTAGTLGVGAGLYALGADPFTMAARGWAASRVGGAVAGFGMGMGIGYAATLPVQWAAGHMAQGGAQELAFGSALRKDWRSLQTGSLQRGLSTEDMRSFSDSIKMLSHIPDLMTDAEELMRVARKLRHSGMLLGVTNGEQLKDEFKKSFGMIKTIAEIAGTTLEEASEHLVRLRRAGFYGNEVGGMLRTRSAAGVLGVDMGIVQGAQLAGAGMSQSMGGLRGTGAEGVTGYMGILSMAMKRGMVNQGTLTELSGGQTGGESLAGTAQALYGASLSFAQSAPGTMALAAFGEQTKDGTFTGRINRGLVDQFLSGRLSFDDVKRLGQGNLGNPISIASFQSMRGVLGTELAKVSPGLLQAVLRGMTSANATQYLLQNITGMSQPLANLIMKLGPEMTSLREQSAAAQLQSDRSAAYEAVSARYTPEGIWRRFKTGLANYGPVQLQAAGAGVVRSFQDYARDITDTFSGIGRGRINAEAATQANTAIMRSLLMGTPLSGAESLEGGTPNIDTSFLMGTGRYDSYLARGVGRSLLPGLGTAFGMAGSLGIPFGAPGAALGVLAGAYRGAGDVMNAGEYALGAAREDVAAGYSTLRGILPTGTGARNEKLKRLAQSARAYYLRRGKMVSESEALNELLSGLPQGERMSFMGTAEGSFLPGQERALSGDIGAVFKEAGFTEQDVRQLTGGGATGSQLGLAASALLEGATGGFRTIGPEQVRRLQKQNEQLAKKFGISPDMLSKPGVLEALRTLSNPQSSQDDLIKAADALSNAGLAKGDYGNVQRLASTGGAEYGAMLTQAQQNMTDIATNVALQPFEDERKRALSILRDRGLGEYADRLEDTGALSFRRSGIQMAAGMTDVKRRGQFLEASGLSKPYAMYQSLVSELSGKSMAAAKGVLGRYGLEGDATLLLGGGLFVDKQKAMQLAAGIAGAPVKQEAGEVTLAEFTKKGTEVLDQLIGKLNDFSDNVVKIEETQSKLWAYSLGEKPQ